MNPRHSFRAWDGRQMTSDFALINGNCWVEKNPKTTSYVEVYTDGRQETYYSDWATYRRVDYKIMQFTGLLDIRGIDIYEGDIIRSDKNCMRAAGYEKGEVIFYESCFRVQDVALSIIVQAFHPIIVGNIHKNPELLKGCD